MSKLFKRGHFRYHIDSESRIILLSALKLFRSCNSEGFGAVGFGGSEGVAAGWTDAGVVSGWERGCWCKIHSLESGRKGVEYSFM